MDAPDNRAVLYRSREQELLALADTMTAPARDDLIRVALVWKRLAEQAEKDLLKSMEEPGP
jgi:DNA-binding TFAR19-related protein (PDSD5 family)